MTRDALIDETESEAAVLAEHLDDWTVDVVNGWPTGIQNVPSFQTADTPERAAAMVERWRAFGGLIDQLTANLRRGLADGRVAAHTPVSRVIDALTTTLATPDEESALLEPLRREPGSRHGTGIRRSAGRLRRGAHGRRARPDQAGLRPPPGIPRRRGAASRPPGRPSRHRPHPRW